jgi:hypothetical protein
MERQRAAIGHRGGRQGRSHPDRAFSRWRLLWLGASFLTITAEGDPEGMNISKLAGRELGGI